MAITLLDSAVNGTLDNPTSKISVTLPGGAPNVGDLILLDVKARADTDTATCPGFTAVPTHISGGQASFDLLYRVAQSGDGDTYQVTYSTSDQGKRLLISRWGGSWGTDPFDVEASMLGEVVATPSYDFTPTAGKSALSYVQSTYFNGTGYTPGTGLTELDDGLITGDNNPRCWAAYRIDSSTSGSYAISFTLANCCFETSNTRTASFIETTTQDISLALINQTAATFNPTVTSLATIDLARISQTATAFAPTVTSSAAAALARIDQTAVAFAPRLRYDQQVDLGFINQAAAAFAPSLAKLEIFLGRITQTAAAYAPTIDTGEIVFPFVLDQTAVAFAPTVSTPALQTITFGLINQLARAKTPYVSQPGVPASSFVELLYDGVDIIDDVIIADAQFTTQANGVPGSCRVRVKDTPRTRAFVAGKSLLLRVDGDNVWRGYVAMIRRGFAFDAEDRTGDKPRFFVLDGFDVNILFRKRVVFNVNDPEDLTGPLYTADNTPDTTAFEDLFADYIDLGGDGLDTETLVEHVGYVNVDQNASPIQPSGTWENTMRGITALTNAIFYIDPDLNVVHTDVDTPNAPLDLSDQPIDAGYRAMEIVYDGTGLVNDALVWGIALGGTQVVIARDEDATSIATHGRWQYGELNGSMYKQATVNRRAASIVDGSPLSKRGAKNDRISVACTVFENGFRVAQKVRFESTAFDFSDVIPIRRMDITFINPTALRYRLFLSHEIDMPWGFFDNYFYDYDPPGIPQIDIIEPRLPELTPCDETDAGPIFGEPHGVAIPNCGGATSNDLHIGPTVGGPPTWGNGSSYPIGVELFHGATYRVTYTAIHRGPSVGLRDTPIGLVLIDASGAFRLATMNMGSNFDGTAITTATFDFIGFGNGSEGTSRCFYLYMFDWNYPNDHDGSEANAHFSYVEGPDPRFENQEFIIGRGGGQRPCEGGETVITIGGGGRWDFDGDGTTTLYTLPGGYIPGTTRVYVDGLFQRPGHEYTESDPEAGEITFLFTPDPQAQIAVFYEVSKP